MVSDDLVEKLSEWWEYDHGRLIDQAKARIEALQAQLAERDKACAEWSEVSQRNYQRAKAAEAQLAKAREDALREAADLFPEADISDDILALIDTPTPAPSPDALVKAALEYLAESFEKFSPTAAKVMRDLSNHPAIRAAIIERAGK
jgi:hypothetical protein